MPSHQTDGERIGRMKAVLDEMRLCLLQQSLAHDSGVLSVEELDYRNTDIKKQTINYQQDKCNRTNKKYR